MADTDVRPSRNEGAPSGVSYKDKLLQPSDKDELSVPDQPELPKLPPTEDEGSPPMTIPVEAPAGADESSRDQAPTEGASATDNYTTPTDIKTTGGGAGAGKGAGDSAASSDTAGPAKSGAAGDADTAGTAQISVPDTSDVTAVAGTELSDVEKEVISDPSTADLLAAATADSAPAAAAAANDTPAPANVMTIQPDESSDVKGIQSDISAVLPGVGSRAGKPIVTAADAAAGSTGTAAAPEPDDQGQGEVLGEQIEVKVPSDESAAQGDESALRNAPGSAFGKKQAPAAADDPAAVPAAAGDLPADSSSSSSDVAAAPSEVKAPKLPTEPAVSAGKEEEDVVSDAAAAEPESGSSDNPLAAAVEAVTHPVAAALSELKDVFIGPDITLGGESESTEQEKKE